MAASVSVCPSAVVEAPVERVWGLLTSPDRFHTWLDVTVASAEPEGPVRPGQHVRMTTRAFGLTLSVRFHILEVDAARHRLHLLAYLPLGLVNDETVTMTLSPSPRPSPEIPGGRGEGEREGEWTLVRFG